MVLLHFTTFRSFLSLLQTQIRNSTPLSVGVYKSPRILNSILSRDKPEDVSTIKTVLLLLCCLHLPTLKTLLPPHLTLSSPMLSRILLSLLHIQCCSSPGGKQWISNQHRIIRLHLIYSKYKCFLCVFLLSFLYLFLFWYEPELPSKSQYGS